MLREGRAQRVLLRSRVSSCWVLSWYPITWHRVKLEGRWTPCEQCCSLGLWSWGRAARHAQMPGLNCGRGRSAVQQLSPGGWEPKHSSSRGSCRWERGFGGVQSLHWGIPEGGF